MTRAGRLLGGERFRLGAGAAACTAARLAVIAQAVRVEPQLGHLVEGLPVHVADHDGRYQRVAGGGFGGEAG